jgi:elongation factor Ts
MQINAKTVKELRDKTGAGIMDCKEALVEANGNVEEAIKKLREKGLKAAEKKASRETTEGLVESYIHPGNRVGVLLELNCETDFVARTNEFQQLAKDITMQIAAAKPEYISREEVPDEVVQEEKEILKNQALKEGKPERIVEKIIEGRIGKFFSQKCLLEQFFIKDDKKTVNELIKGYIAKLGENIVVRRFTIYLLGQ